MKAKMTPLVFLHFLVCYPSGHAGKACQKHALVGAATAFAYSLKGGSGKAADPPKQHATAVSMSVSPSKAIELRMKKLEKLRYLQQLHEDGILTDTELAELKRDIFSSLRKL